jgi:hypothetical protein
MEKLIENLINAINAIVDKGGVWEEKRDQILEYCSENDKTNLLEFTEWFGDIEDEDEEGDAE